MLNTSLTINLGVNTQAFKEDTKKESLNIERQNSFKDYLSNKINSSKEITSKEIDNNNDIKEREVNNDKLSTEISEKIENSLNDEEIDKEDLEEILYLLSNFIEVNLKDVKNNNTMDTSINDNAILNNFNGALSKDEKDALENINNLLEEYLNKSNENLTTSVSIDDFKSKIMNELKKLISTFPNNSKEEAENKTNIDISNDLNEGNVELNLEETKNLNEDTSAQKEEEILMKFLDDDNNQKYSNNLNYYDNLNRINFTEDIVKEPVVINKETMDLDIIKNVKYMIKNEVQELKVKIYPKELGEITIKILSEEGIMKAELKAVSKETYDLLNSNLNEIKKTLESQNIKIQEINIGIYNEDTTFFSGNENSRDSFENQKFYEFNVTDLEEDHLEEDHFTDTNVNFLA